MTKQQYERLSAPFRGRRLVPLCDRALTALVFLAYPALLLRQWAKTGSLPLRELWVPASWLLLVTLLRILIDRPRPYERLGIEPLIARESKGRSFPSRHAFSVSIIATTAWWLCPPAGIALTVAALLLCATRVVGGVHYPSDVAAGAAIGVLGGVLGYWVIPL